MDEIFIVDKQVLCSFHLNERLRRCVCVCVCWQKTGIFNKLPESLAESSLN